MKQKVIIDTDPGCDDALALILACLSDKFDIKAITTVAGNAPIELTTCNAWYMLNLVHANNIPLYSGAKKPLNRAYKTDNFFGKSGLGGITAPTQATLTNNACQKIVEIVKKYPHEITLITLGPLTNIAQAFMNDEETMNLAKEIIMAGGIIESAGNITATAEFNFYSDPEAVSIVLKSRVKKTILPLDLRDKVHFFWQDVLSTKNLIIAPIITKMLEPFVEKYPNPAAVLFDPFAIYYALHCDIPTYLCFMALEHQTQRILCTPITDLGDNAHKVQVVKDISSNDFKKFLKDTLA